MLHGAARLPAMTGSSRTPPVPPERAPSSSPWAPVFGFSAAARAGGWVATAGMTAVAGDGSVVGGDSAYRQAREALRKVLEALAACGAGAEHVVQTRMYISDAAHADDVGRAHGEVFAATRPAATMVVTGFIDPRMLVEIEARAHVAEPSAG
jgi:enamine deaminase RidA (YjgF/YER057c/UK114 family)